LNNLKQSGDKKFEDILPLYDERLEDVEGELKIFYRFDEVDPAVIENSHNRNVRRVL